MKKKILGFLLCGMLACGCGKTYQEATTAAPVAAEDYCNGYFTVIAEWYDVNGTYCIAYAKDTKVKYLISESGYKFGITALYNADGTLQIYEEK